MGEKEKNRSLRGLPSVDAVLREPALEQEAALHSPALVAGAARDVLAALRSEILSFEGAAPGAVSMEGIVARVKEEVATLVSTGAVRVVNASGTVLHTNIGRAVLAKEAIDAVLLAASGNTDLEFDLSTGERGERDARVEALLKRLTGAEAACVVNNNAAAVLITLNTLAEGREVVVSRGELIEIGGSFRLPEIIVKSGCLLKEVGTTNRTHERDYESATGPQTALLFKAHTSNYRVVGFTTSVGLGRLAEIAAANGLPVVEDLGSGSLANLFPGRDGEPTVAQSLANGASVVTFSGDKLLGGPQAGLICGKKELVDRIRKNPLKRALRADKMTLAALEATLRLYLNMDTVTSRVPALRYLTRPLDEVEEAARKACALMKKAFGDGFTVEVVDSKAVAGAGALPGRSIPSKAVAVSHASAGPDKLFAAFLSNRPAILGRVHDGRFLIDMRAIDDPADVVPADLGSRLAGE